MGITNNLENLGVFKDFSDGTLKTVFDAGGKQIIEVTLLGNKEEMDVVCAPTHHFCNLGCKMCHLTNKGLNKQMTPIEPENFIEALIKGVTKQTEEGITRRTDKKKLLISFMGVGEPLLNKRLISEVYRQRNYIKEVLGYDEIGYAVSTMMPRNSVDKFTKMINSMNMPLKLHFSLHTPINEDRFELIPSSKVTVENALAYLVNFRNTIQSNEAIMEKYEKFHRTGDPIEIHYTLIDGVNDNPETLKAMCELLKQYNVPIKFIRFNPLGDLKKSDQEANWVSTISEYIPGLRIKTYTPPGKEIGSSCGEFTKHYYHEEIETEVDKKEFEDWKQKHQIENDGFQKTLTN